MAFDYQKSIIKQAPMQKTTTNYDVIADEIPDEWMDELKKDGLASLACKGASKKMIDNLVRYSQQLAIISSKSNISISAN
ncbi:MAG: hypothetical protein LBH92_00040 [Bacteroidales bacterium]|jgi:hypothetical protein|nr:hypothetical protein [Bacteroidales bacterium]